MNVGKVQIKDLKILRQDEMIRKLSGAEAHMADTRCAPIMIKGACYNLFIDGTVHEHDLFKAVIEGKQIDTSESVHPETHNSLIVDV